MTTASGSTDFTRKLRAAVKAKIEEFGLEVDEELPDYVMIMVGNKKTKEHMRSDLKLFLGDNTSLFVEWLFGFFRKVKGAGGEGSTTMPLATTTSESALKKEEAGKKQPNSSVSNTATPAKDASQKKRDSSSAVFGRHANQLPVRRAHEIKLSTRALDEEGDISRGRRGKRRAETENGRHHRRARNDYSDSGEESGESDADEQRRKSHQQRGTKRGRESSHDNYSNERDEEEENEEEGEEAECRVGGFKKFSSPKELREGSPEPKRHPSRRGRAEQQQQSGGRGRRETPEDPHRDRRQSAPYAKRPHESPPPTARAAAGKRENAVAISRQHSSPEEEEHNAEMKGDEGGSQEGIPPEPRHFRLKSQVVVPPPPATNPTDNPGQRRVAISGGGLMSIERRGVGGNTDGDNYYRRQVERDPHVRGGSFRYANQHASLLRRAIIDANAVASQDARGPTPMAQIGARRRNEVGARGLLAKSQATTPPPVMLVESIQLNYDNYDERTDEMIGAAQPAESEEEVIRVDSSSSKPSNAHAEQKIVVTMRSEILATTGGYGQGRGQCPPSQRQKQRSSEIESVIVENEVAKASGGASRTSDSVWPRQEMPPYPDVVQPPRKRKRRADDLSRAFLAALSGMAPSAKASKSSLSSAQPRKAITLSQKTLSTSVGRPAMASKPTAKTTTTGHFDYDNGEDEELSRSSLATSDQSVSLSAMPTLNYDDQEGVEVGAEEDSQQGVSPTAAAVPILSMPMVWDGQINLGGDDDDESSSEGNEEEINQMLATVAAIRAESAALGGVAADAPIIPPTAVLSRPTLYYHQQQSIIATTTAASTVLDARDLTTYTSYATLGYNPEEYQTNFMPPVRSALEGQKIMERCRFWPDCRNEDLCAYQHPTKLCQKFPNCWFGEKCLNIHPRCRFAPNCTKPNCRFAHYKLPVSIFSTAQQSGGKAPAIAAPPSLNSPPLTTSITAGGVSTGSTTDADARGLGGVGSPTPNLQLAKPSTPFMAPTTGQGSRGPAAGVACRYGGRCQNINCVYSHPPACRFGASCTKGLACPFLHRAAAAATVPHMAQSRFKWVSPALASSTSSL